MKRLLILLTLLCCLIAIESVSLHRQLSKLKHKKVLHRAKALENCASIPTARQTARTRTDDHRHSRLNEKINAGYAKFAICFQTIVEGNKPVADLGARAPVWFGFAPYASRVVGKGELALEAVIKAYGVPEERGVLESIWDVATTIVNPAGALIEDSIEFGRAVREILNAMMYGSASGDLNAFGDTGIIAESIKRAGVIVYRKSGIKPFVEALLTALELGNRLIYGDVGGMGEDYLKWRHNIAAPSAELVLNEFSPQMSTTPAQSRAAYDFALAHLDDNPMPVDFSSINAGTLNVQTAACAVAGLALYEEAGTTADTARADKLIKFGNNLLAYREQAHAVQPAFDSELEIFQMMTPTVNLRMRNDLTWSFFQHMGSDDSILAKNWGLFNDRWAPIVSAFQVGYDNYPSSIWPMPPSDPHN